MRRIALVRGPGLSVFELQSYQPLMARFELTAFGLAQHSVDTDTLAIPCKRLRWKDSVSGRSALNAYRSRVKGQRYFMPGLEDELADFDLIHSSELATTFSWQCVQQKKKLNVPLVITSTENIRHPAWNDSVRSQLKKEIIDAADFYFALTPDARDVLISEAVDPERIAVIPFGLDLERFSPGAADPQWLRHFGVKEDEFVVVFAGRFVWEKGIYDLASAVREMDPRKLRVLFVGRGPERETLESFITKLGLSNVASCHDPLRYGQMEQLYRLADVLILPSLPTLGVREQFGMTLTEAMACAIPVVATRCGSMPWVIGDAGLLAESGSSSSIAECLNQLRSSTELRKTLGRRGRAIAEQRYDLNRVAMTIGQHFDRLLERGKGR